MFFLIEYDRLNGCLVTFDPFKDSDRKKAEGKRLDLELDLNRRRVKHEVVILEAAEERLLRHTHRRYFDSLLTIAASTGTTPTST